MTPGYGLTFIIWTLTIISEGLLCLLFVIRPGRKQYPAFRTYVNFCFSRSLVLYAINASGNHYAYFYASYVGVLLESVIKFFAVVEITKELFHPVSILPGKTYSQMCISVTTITAACIGASIFFPSLYPHLLFASARLMDRTITLLFAGVMWVIVIYKSRLGIPWRTRLFGIVVGFGFDLTVNSAVLAISTSSGRAITHSVGMVVCFSALVTMSTWTYFFLQPEPALISAVTPLPVKVCPKKPPVRAFLSAKKRAATIDL